MSLIKSLTLLKCIRPNHMLEQSTGVKNVGGGPIQRKHGLIVRKGLSRNVYGARIGDAGKYGN